MDICIIIKIFFSTLKNLIEISELTQGITPYNCMISRKKRKIWKFQVEVWHNLKTLMKSNSLKHEILKYYEIL